MKACWSSNSAITITRVVVKGRMTNNPVQLWSTVDARRVCRAMGDRKMQLRVHTKREKSCMCSEREDADF